VAFDRPGIADGPYIVGKGIIQAESGFVYSDFIGHENALVPTIMLRKSFLKGNELRLIYNYEPQFIRIIDYHLQNNFDPVAIGIKKKLLHEKKAIPEASFIVNVFYPVQKISREVSMKELNVESSFQFHDNLNKHISINYNAGLLLNRNDKAGILSYSFCMNWNAHHLVSFFGEGFGYAALNGSWREYGFDAGLVIEIKKHYQIDFSFIVNQFERKAYQWLNIGFSALIIRTK
jgi:hypothetical protein